jgi:signal transduction histidine kinase
MSPAPRPLRQWPWPQRALAAAALAGLAVAGNVAHVPLLFGVDFIFGSVAALVALVWLGPAAGLAAAVAGGLYTLHLWGHPYALIILTLEVAVVALLIRRDWYLVAATALFWALLGGPLALAFYSGPLGMEPGAAGLIALKQPVNGIFNATVASFALLALQIFTPFGPQAPAGNIRLGHLLFSLFVTLSLLPGMGLMVAESWQDRQELERSLAERMDLAARVFSRSGPASPASLQDLRVIPLDDQGRPLGQEAPPAAGPARPTGVEGLRIHWAGEPGLPRMKRWKEGYYVRTVPLAHGGTVARVRVQAPAAGLVTRLRASQRQELWLLAALAVAAALGAAVLSRFLVRPLDRLNHLAQGLPERIRADSPLPAFPQSRITEVDTFIRAIRHMARALTDSLRSSEAARTNLERQVRARTADLERRNAELRRLAEVAAHHLQEPVRRSLAFAQRLHKRLPEREHELARLEEQLTTMSTLISDLQGYLAYQTRVPQPQAVSLGAAVARAREAVMDEATEATLTYEPDPLPEVPADPALLETLLRQILANAVRYRRPGVPLHIQIAARHRSGSWEIAISDNGRGMEAAYLERVFRLFERLYPEQDTEGSGLGLALARLIVENHGGWIRAESGGPRQGTTIRFTLPDPPETAGTAESPTNPGNL